jgi:hypothetical protein
MRRILQSLLALISLLLLALMAARANSAPWQEPETTWQAAPAEAAVSPPPHVRPAHRCLVPGPQPGTHLQGQPFAYGYFGARARPLSVYQRSYDADWFQWTFYRAD